MHARWPLTLLIIMSLLCLSSVAAHAAAVQSITFCMNVEGEDFTAINVRETFGIDTPAIHAVVRIDRVSANSVFKGTWVSIDAISIPNYEIDSYQIEFQESGPATAHVSLSRPDKGWPVGHYRLDVYLDDTQIGSKAFTLSANPAPANIPTPDEIKKKRAALEAAHEAGILSDAEYAAKKAALEASLPATDAETQKKLQALDAALAAGIISEQEYRQKKALLTGAGAQAAPAAPAPPQAQQRPAPAAHRQGSVYRHPAGFSFWYPETWNVTQQDEALQLIPSDAATSAQGSLELYFLVTESTAGFDIQKLDDPLLVEYLDEQVKSLSAALQYAGKASTFRTAVGEGAVLLWRATGMDGQAIVARVFITRAGDTAIMLVAMGLQTQIEARDKDLHDLFQSTTRGQAQAPLTEPSAGERPSRGTTAPPVTTAPARAAAQEPLKALETARNAGVIGEQEYAQKKAELQATGAASGTAMGPKTEGKTYRHVIGFSFWYPGAWTVKALEDTLQLIPPDPGTTAGGDPTEIYAIIGDSVAGMGVTGPDDPRVVQYMDQAVASMSPFLRRTAAPAAVATGSGSGIVMNWEGRSPGGDLVCARAYVSIIKDHGVALLGLCFKDRLEARDAELQRMFASFSFGAGQVDPQLVGQWSFLTTQSMTNWSPFETSYSRAQMVSDTTGTLVLAADGTWTRTDRTQMLAGAGGVWLESNETKSSNGRWYAGNGALFLIWQDNSWEDYKYELRQSPEGTRLLLVTGQRGELWQRN